MAESFALFPECQRQAYKAVLDKLPESRSKVLAALIASETGLTTQELCDRLGVPVNRVSGRITELRKLFLVVNSGSKRRNDESGLMNTVWTYKEQSE